MVYVVWEFAPESRDDIRSHQVKMVYTASLNDQVVPLYSGLFTAASHPLILRALYIDGDVYQCVIRFFQGRFVPEIADATPARVQLI